MDLIIFSSLIISFLLLGFFSGIEIAFISSNKLSIELRKKQGSYSGIVWSDFIKNPGRFMITILL
ncbi:MAG TPA: CNNM domain-containing protein, partial [Hanamia sp.]|nr:CNNM domain-containing protein [Hanamia sp.]